MQLGQGAESPDTTQGGSPSSGTSSIPGDCPAATVRLGVEGGSGSEAKAQLIEETQSGVRVCPLSSRVVVV